MKLGIFLLISSYIFGPSLTNIYTQNIRFKITNIRNTKGNFVLCFFNSEDKYESGKECIRKEISKNNIRNGEINFDLPLPYGTYGVVLLDDENLNDEMDYGLLMPKEGFGFSNFVPIIRKPQFKDIDFNVNGSANNPVTIKVKYM